MSIALLSISLDNLIVLSLNCGETKSIIIDVAIVFRTVSMRQY
ncbi:hypothetical protein [Rickettsia endosymbiont of Orchestes rusci]